MDDKTNIPDWLTKTTEEGQREALSAVAAFLSGRASAEVMQNKLQSLSVHDVMPLVMREDVPEEFWRILVASATYHVIKDEDGLQYEEEFYQIVRGKREPTAVAAITGLAEAGAFRMILTFYANSNHVRVRKLARDILTQAAKGVGANPKEFGLDPDTPLNQRLKVADLNFKELLDSVQDDGSVRLSDLNNPWAV